MRDLQHIMDIVQTLQDRIERRLFGQQRVDIPLVTVTLGARRGGFMPRYFCIDIGEVCLYDTEADSEDELTVAVCLERYLTHVRALSEVLAEEPTHDRAS